MRRWRPETMDGTSLSGLGREVGVELHENGLDGHELLVAEDCPGELQEVLRALGGVTARKSDLESLGRGASLEVRTTNLVLLPAYDSDGCPIDALATAIRSRSPHVSLFVCAATLREVQGRLPSLAWAGVDQVYVLATQSDRSMLAAAIRRRLLAPPPAEALRALARSTVACEGKTLATWLLRNGCFALGVKDVRVMFGKDLKTLQKYLASFDKIGVLLRLGITLHARELQRRGIVGKTAAARLGLSGSVALWRKERFIRHHAFTGVLHDIPASPR